MELHKYKSLKIAIFVPYIEGLGGHLRVIARLASYLKSKGHYIEIFTQRYNKDDTLGDFKNLKINILKPQSKSFAPFVFLLKKVKKFDVVVVGAFPATLGTIRNKPTFYICYTPKRDFYNFKQFALQNSSTLGKFNILLKNLMFKRIDFIAAQKATVLSPVSETVRRRSEKFYKRGGTGIIYCGIDFKDFKSGKYEDYMLIPSRFAPAKRVDMAVEAMGYVKNKKIKLYVVGDGPDRAKIERLAKRHKNVKLFGGISDSELRKLYSNALAVIYLPVSEELGLVPIEAGASEKAVIGANRGGLKETVINGKTGFLISNPTPKKVAEKVDFLAKNRKTAIKMGKASKVYTKKFDWKNIMPEWERLIYLAYTQYNNHR